METYVDQAGGLARIGGNKALYKRLLQSFINDPLMDTLAGDITRGDIQAAQKSAHAIKGASANLSLMKLSEAVRLLEADLKAGNCDINALKACLDTFDKTKEAVNQILNDDESAKM